MFAISGIKTSRPTADSFALSAKRWPRLLEVVFALVFLGFWYSNLLGTDSFASVESLTTSIHTTVKAQPFLALLLLAPLTFVPRLIANLRMIVTGQSWLVDGSSKSILRNGARQAQFADVTAIQIREFRHDKHPAYRLTIILDSGQTLAIHSGANQSEIQAIANDVADLIGVPIAMV